MVASGDRLFARRSLALKNWFLSALRTLKQPRVCRRNKVADVYQRATITALNGVLYRARSAKDQPVRGALRLSTGTIRRRRDAHFIASNYKHADLSFP